MVKNLNNKRVGFAPPVYIGPEYHRGITMPDHTLVRPAEFTPQEVDDFLQKHPQYAAWWSFPAQSEEINLPDEDANKIVDTPFGKMKVSKNLIPPSPVQ